MKFLLVVSIVFLISFNPKFYLKAEFMKSWLETNLFHRLKVEHLKNKFVKSPTDCGLLCLQNVSCFSFNVAINADEDGQLRCELLGSNRHRAEVKLIEDPLFHHYGLLMKVGQINAFDEKENASTDVD